MEASATSLPHLGGGAACALQDIRHRRQQLPGARRLRHWGGGPQVIYLFPRELVYYGEVEVATTAGAVTAVELLALRRRHCEAAAVIHRQAVG